MAPQKKAENVESRRLGESEIIILLLCSIPIHAGFLPTRGSETNAEMDSATFQHPFSFYIYIFFVRVSFSSCEEEDKQKKNPERGFQSTTFSRINRKIIAAFKSSEEQDEAAAVFKTSAPSLECMVGLVVPSFLSVPRCPAGRAKINDAALM